MSYRPLETKPSTLTEYYYLLLLINNIYSFPKDRPIPPRHSKINYDPLGPKVSTAL